MWRKLWSKKARRFYLKGVVSGIVGLILFYQVANWRGAKAWADAEARLEAAGERWTLEDLTRPQIPDHTNFFAIPALHGIATIDHGDPDSGPHAELRARLMTLDPTDAGNGEPQLNQLFRDSPRTGQPIDFEILIEHARKARTLRFPSQTLEKKAAARFLTAFELTHQEILEALSKGSNLSGSQITPHLRERMPIDLPFSDSGFQTSLSKLSHGLSLRVSAAAQSGNFDKACNDLFTIGKISRALHEEPDMISSVLVAVVDAFWHQAIWETIASNAAAPETLEQLQIELESTDHFNCHVNVHRWELTTALNLTAWIENNRRRLIDEIEGSRDDHEDNSLTPFIMRRAPKGWYDHNRAHLAQWHLEYLLAPAQSESWLAVHKSSRALGKLISQKRADTSNYPHMTLAILASGTKPLIIPMAIHGDVGRTFCVTACALERYRFKHHEYPSSLAQLEPEFLKKVPSDPTAPEGSPIRYQTEGDRYRLWVFGLDQEDDDGDPGNGERSPTSSKFQYDWIWWIDE